MSRVYNRSSGLLIGDLNVNLAGVNKEQAELLKTLITAIHPLSCVFEVTIQSLSKTLFTPSKDCNKNYMKDGLLGSLVKGSILVVDETVMDEGKIDHYGVPNMQALGKLIKNQTIGLDFKYSQQDLPCAVPVIVLSPKRALFRDGLYLPLET